MTTVNPSDPISNPVVSLSSQWMPNWLRQRASLSPNSLALIAAAERWTFRELEQRAISAARRLASVLQPGSGRVAILMRNSPDFVTLVHATSLLGRTMVLLNARLTSSEIAYQLADSEASVLLYDAVNTANALSAAHDLPTLRLVRVADQSDTAANLWSLPETEISLRDGSDADEVYSIIYTSGTTGRPKGAVLTYHNFWSNTIASALNLGLHADDRWLACLPLFHVGGFSILLKSVIYGIPMLLHETFDAAAINRSVDEDHATIVSAVSVMLQRMLDARGDRPYPPYLRCILLGGGPAPRVLLERCAAIGLPVAQTYGLTETCSQIATLSPADALRKLGSAGKPLFLSELRIEHNDKLLDVDEIGEIVVRGPTVTPGYLNRPDATAKALRGGWLHTGDLGYLDDEGYLYVVDRRDDLIISGGENVYPAEIEAVLLGHPAVEEAGVIGILDDKWGRVPVAVVKLRSDLPTTTEADLQAFCGERLARYKIPAHIRFATSLPRNAAGKLLRRSLAESWS